MREASPPGARSTDPFIRARDVATPSSESPMQRPDEGRAFAHILGELVQATPDSIGIATAAGELVFLNRAGRRLLGIAPYTQLRGWSLQRMHTNAAALADGLVAAARSGLWTGEALVRADDGEEIPVSQLLVAHRMRDGTVEYVSIVMRDLRARHALEQQLRQAQRMEAIGQLAGGIAHDFNNLLFAIKTNACLLRMDLPPGSALVDDVREIDETVDRAASLTQQLLAFSRKQVLQIEAKDVNQTIRQMDRMLRRLISADIELSIVLEEGRAIVLADASQLEQVIVNLAVNARDAMPAGGRLTIATQNVEVEPGEWVGGAEVVPGAYVRIVIADTGVGMRPEVLARIFEPFFTTKERGKGTGLGLSTVYGIVTQTGGYLDVKTEVGVGTTFSILLPCHVDAAPDADAANLDRALEAKLSGRVLLVDDDAAVRRATRKLLTRFGLTVLEAGNGDEAMRLCTREDEAIDLLLTDLVMPLMSGSELVEKVAALHPSIRTVLMSGYTDELALPTGIRAGRSAFLKKPFTPQKLHHVLHELLLAD